MRRQYSGLEWTKKVHERGNYDALCYTAAAALFACLACVFANKPRTPTYH